MTSIPRFYVYILYRPDGRPFYVGKGQGKRIDVHEKLASKGHKAHRYSIIRKVWSEGGEVIKQKVYETDDQDDAYAMEHYLIASIGRENLANENDGGYGNRGWVVTDAFRERQRELRTGSKLSPETWAKVQAAKVGKPRSAECIAKMRAALARRVLPDDWGARTSAANKGKPWSAAERASIPASLRVPKPNARGEKHHNAKWTVERVREIRQLYKDGVGPAEIARRLDMSKGAVTGILYSKRAWKWLDDGETT